jgi:hypothetical protein
VVVCWISGENVGRHTCSFGLVRDITLREQKRERIDTLTHSLTFIHFTSLRVFSFSIWIWHFHSHFDCWFMTHITQHRDEGLTPEIPRRCPEKLAQLMKMCWNKDPNQRPVSSLSLNLNLLNLLKLCLFWFVKLMLKLTYSHIEEKWNESLSHSFFSCWFLCSLIWNTHKLKELWNDLWNVATTTTTIMKWNWHLK